MYHYTYRITNTQTNYYYTGSRSCNCIPSEDIGHKYFSSSTNKLFIQDQKDNPNDYIYKIVYINEEDRKNATNFEIKYHKRLNVRIHPSFLNKANATSNGFCGRGKEIHIDKYELETLLKTNSSLEISIIFLLTYLKCLFNVIYDVSRMHHGCKYKGELKYEK